MIENCTLLLNSYDGGEDCWDYFFLSLKRQWPEMNMPIVLNTESKQYKGSVYSNVKSFSFYPPKKKIPWGRRLIETLKHIDTEFVLFFLEDNWLDRPVNNVLFKNTLEYMSKNKDISSMEFLHIEHDGYDNIDDERFVEYELRPNNCPYHLNAQVALWKREELIEVTRNHETPWEWEVYGSERIQKYDKKIYVLRDNISPPFSYQIKFEDKNEVRDGMIYQGKWDKMMVDYFSKIYDLSKIDFSIRGYYAWNKDTSDKQYTLLDRVLMPNLIGRIWNKFVYNRFRRWLSLK